MFVYNL